jgi:hypothetical protein
MKSRAFLAALLLISPAAHSQSKPPQKKLADPDRLGLTCVQILAMRSGDWVANFAKEKGSAPDSTIRALAAYGTCYDARTAQLARTLGAKAKGPSAAARKEIANLDQALKDFTDLALASTNPTADSVKRAYAALYEKHFRYDFYLGYEQKSATQRPAANIDSAPAALAPQQASPALPPPADKSAARLDPLTKAKNHFGGLFGMLPEEKIHEVHAAFGKVLAATEGNNETKLAVYRYAIFVLEPPSAQPYSPPPF